MFNYLFVMFTITENTQNTSWKCLTFYLTKTQNRATITILVSNSRKQKQKQKKKTLHMRLHSHLTLKGPVDVQLYLLPLYFGTQRTVGGRPLMLKCLPSKCEHCSSRKSLRPCGQGSVLHERNFILRPTQNLPPLVGLDKRGHMVYEFYFILSI